MFDALVENRPHIRTYYEDMDNPRLKKLFQNPKGLLDLLIRHACRTETFPIPECVEKLKAGFITAAYSTGDLARLMGTDRSTIGRWLNELEAMGVLDRPFDCATSGTRNIYVLGYCHPVPMKEAGGFKRAFVYYINDPLPEKGDAEMHQGGDAEMHQGGDAKMHQGGDAKMHHKHKGHDSQEVSEHRRQDAALPRQKKIVPGVGSQGDFGIKPSTPGKTEKGASGRAKADPNGKANLLNGSGVARVEFKHSHENEIIAAFEKKYREVEGRPYDTDEKDRAKVRHLLTVGHDKEEILAAINFYMAAHKRFSWGSGTPTLALFAAPKFYARLAAKDKTLFVEARKDTTNTGEAMTEAEVGTVEMLKEIWS
jgi:hypothetical protein